MEFKCLYEIAWSRFNRWIEHVMLISNGEKNKLNDDNVRKWRNDVQFGIGGSIADRVLSSSNPARIGDELESSSDRLSFVIRSLMDSRS